MKPIIIYAEEKDGKITITKEELQRIVDEAYRQGKTDGNWYYTTNPITVTPTWQPPYKITCTNHGTATDHTTNDKGEPI